MRIIDDVKLDFDDVLIVPKRSRLRSRSSVNLHRGFTFLNSRASYEGIPIIAANMDTIGTFSMVYEFHNHDMMVSLHKFYTIEDHNNQISKFGPKFSETAILSVGMTDKDKEKLDKLGMYYKYICIDVANGYSIGFEEFCTEVRENFPDKVIMAGNVCTPEMTETLILNCGVDIVKIGIGPGSVCTTRKITGCGYPQLSAIIECADAAHGIKGHICADGGIKNPGDVGKAFGAGADFVMIGGYFAGHDECDGELIFDDGVPVRMKFYGMSSEEAMNKHYGGVAEHRAAEGKLVEVPYKGKVSETIKEILGGLRSTCTYVGALKLKELTKRTNFIKVNATHNVVFGE